MKALSKFLFFAGIAAIIRVPLFSSEPAIEEPELGLKIPEELIIEEPASEIVPQVESVNPYSLEALAAREYGQGELRIEYPWHNEAEFTRYYITYDSDGLNIHGFVNIPVGKGPFPMIIALHGYIPASEYQTLDYSTRYADAITRKGYIVLHPNLRNFPPSDSATRGRDGQTGYTEDVINLLAHVKKEAGQSGSIFEKADLTRMGIWGHSMGGSISLRVISLVPEIKAAVLYGPVTQRYSNASAGYTVTDLESADVSYSVHHGTADEKVSVTGSYRFCEQLEEMGKEHECFFYEGAPHTFYRLGQDEPIFIKRTVDFYERILRGN
ncbi:MAG: dienelactone hydrolase [Chloroflexi bacterium]|nr:dienelactone hydrolase [Chloroflexota bacterium]